MQRSGSAKLADIKRANPIEGLIPALTNQPLAPTNGRELKIRCPFHADEHPSLSINVEKQVWRCHPCNVGGDAITFVEKLHGVGHKAAIEFLADRAGLTTEAAVAIERFEYTDADGTVLKRICRQDGSGGRKRIWQERPDGRGYAKDVHGVKRTPYRLPEVLAALRANPDRSLHYFEGERKVDRAWQLGLAATCNDGGAKKWTDDLSLQLPEHHAIIHPDNDAPGLEHQHLVAESLRRTRRAKSLKLAPPLPGVGEGGDLIDWLAAGGTRERLERIIAATPESNAATTATLIDGAALLDRLATFVRRFVVLTAAQTHAVTLWVLHCHALDAADTTIYLSIWSATARSGKTRLLEVLELLVPRPWLTGRVTGAVLTRKVDKETPTLLLDESDAAFKVENDYSEALRSILNTGYRRSGRSSLCVGQGANLSYKDFRTFCPKAIAGIGHLPDTVQDRAIRIELKRRAANEQVERFRARDVEPEATLLKADLAAFAHAILPVLHDARPAMPPLNDRAADGWELLLAIADSAGGAWPERARAAAMALSGDVDVADNTPRVQLLADIHECFVADDAERLSSEALIEKLTAREDRPWSEWSRGKPLSKTKLAALLKDFGITPTPLWFPGKGSLQGYTRRAFEDVWRRYPPEKAQESKNVNNDGGEPAISDPKTGERPWSAKPAISSTSTERTWGLGDLSPDAGAEPRKDDRADRFRF